MTEIQKLEFKSMHPGQGEEVSTLILKTVNAVEENGFTPAGRTALERYVSPVALEERAKLGYSHELVYVSGILAGVIELKGMALISMLYIHPDYVNKGLGSRLIARAAARCAEQPSKLKHMVVYATDDAVNFYERFGFTRNGSRQEVGGIHSTPYKLPLETKGRSLPSKLHSRAIEMFVFTGTGNSLLVAQTVAEVLKQEGLRVQINSMDKPCVMDLREDTAVGLCFPVACFSTYPTVWRFLKSLPAGEGREIFMLGTMGGFSGGMQGPLRKVLIDKGYKPVAAKFFVMPGNYNNKTLPLDKNAARMEKALLEARFFAYDLLKGRTEWSGGIPLLSSFLHRMAQWRKPWNWFYKTFPIIVDEEKCIRCKRCVENCPENAIEMKAKETQSKKYPFVEGSICQSCQRCVGFCPTGALHVPEKPAEPYRAMSYEDLKAAFEKV